MWVSLLLGVVAAAVLGADDVAAAYGSDGDDELEAVTKVLWPIALAAGLVLAALWALLATRLRRGQNWARVTTWALAATISVVGLVFWTTPSAWGFVVAEAAVLCAICVLLAVPSSSRYFRRA
jgi:uncharacterized membrane protein YhaH (DUF805 family)